MKSKLLVAAAALSLGAFTSLADTVTTTTTTHTSWWSERTSYDRDSVKYNANELNLDLFGTYSHSIRKFDDMFDHTWRHGEWGGGVGMNYFFTKYLGFGVDTFFQRHGHFLNNVSGNLYARAPLGNSGFAPYIYGGAGWRDGSSVGAFHSDELTAHGGVGIEYRFNPHLGVFIDARYTWTDKTADESLVRSGFRIGLR
jgi:opacity protein-like surface antigen